MLCLFKASSNRVFSFQVSVLIYCLLVNVFFATDSLARPDVERRGKSIALVDVDSGNLLYSESDKELRYPASLTKMMTLYLLFEAIDNTKLTLDSKLAISQNAASKPATNLFLKKGDSIRVSDAIKALVVRSANDVATAVAENLAGSEENFVKVMNIRAKELGMRSTNFINASGLPSKLQYSTANDMAKLAIALQKHYPKYYDYFATKEFYFRGKRYKNHNTLLKEYAGVTGLKTGYIRDSGFHLAVSLRQNKRNLVAVYMGADSPKERAKVLTELLDSLKYSRLASFAEKRKPVKLAKKFQPREIEILRKQDIFGKKYQLVSISHKPF